MSKIKRKQWLDEQLVNGKARLGVDVPIMTTLPASAARRGGNNVAAIPMSVALRAAAKVRVAVHASNTPDLSEEEQ